MNGPRLAPRALGAVMTALLAASALVSVGAAPAIAATTGFVTRNGTHLLLDGKPFVFTGLNIYNANSDGWCGAQMNSGSRLDDALTAFGPGKAVIRSWFFQPLAINKGTGLRDWSGFDHTLQVAAAHGIKVIATLTDQWGECGSNVSGNGYKTADWYVDGYRQVQPGMLASYRDWVAEVVARYKGDPTIAFWQLINEAEVTPCPAGDLQPYQTLHDWAADVSGVVKSIDPNHLVSLGTIGSGQCGADGPRYQDLHAIGTIDLCEFHDYGSPTVGIPGDQYNGLQLRIDQCTALNKPIFVGEAGIIPNEVGGTFQARADAFRAKIDAQLGAGVRGFLAWAWSPQATPISTLDNYDVGPGDPALGALDLSAAAQGAWADAGSLSAARFFHTATLLGDGTVLVVGGQDGQGEISDVRVYDPPTNSWIAGAPLSIPRSRHTATVLPNATVLVAGGLTTVPGARYPVASTAIYDPASDSWAAGTAMHFTRYLHTATLLGDQRVLVAGGSGNSDTTSQNSFYQASAEIYSAASGTWSAVPDMRFYRVGHTATLLRSGRVLVAGGEGSAVVGGCGNLCGERLSSAELYDPAANTWTTLPDMHSPRVFATATLLDNGQVLVAGGLAGYDVASGHNVPTATAELFDPATNSWSSAASMATARYEHTVSLLSDGRALVTGGYDDRSGGIMSAEMYDPTTDTWSSAADMSSTRWFHTATVLDDGSVLVAGGAGGPTSTYLASAERFSLPAAPPSAPGAPTSATAAAGDGQASVSWMAPADDGHSPITGYTVTSSPGGVTATVGVTTTAIVTGLTNGTAYTFTVKATNAVGTGPASAPSNSVTPFAKTNQTITFGNLANRTMLQSPFTVTATASSGLPVSFSTTTPTVCTSSGTNGQTITLVGAGTCTVKADQAGNASFNPAPSVSRSFTVSRVSQSITFNALSNRTMLQTPFTVSATASSGLPVTFASTTPSVCTTSGVTGSTVDLLAPGTCTIVASQAGNATYAPAPDKTRSSTVSRAPQTITFTNPGNKTLIQSPLTVTATASSGLQVTFTTTTPAVCTSGGTAGATITFLRTGSCSVVASQPGNAIYAPAASITRTFTVGQATQTINFGPLPTANLQQSPITVTATASSGLTVTFATSSGSVCTAGGPNGATITLLKAGTCKVVASQAGNATYKAAPNVTQSFTVTTAKLAQTITFAPLADRSIGAPPLTLSATASSGLAVSYAIAPASAAICSVSGSVLTLTNTGTCTITASQAGSTIYNAATPVTQSLTATLGGFVQASGTSLVLDGQPFQVFGAAIYQTSNYGHTADPDQIFGWAHDAHLNTLRLTDIFEQTTNDPNAPYREADWQWIDGLIARSQDEGLKVILDLSSYRNWLVWSAEIDHGWVSNCAGTATPAERAEVDFPLLDPYTVAHQADWTQFMTFVANRVNTVSGIKYRNDPTILVVSIAGEPIGPGYDECGRASTEQELTDFFEWSLGEWKSLDPHHLRSTGGLQGTYAGLDGNGDPIPSGQQVDGIAIFSLADNTLPSLHTYPPRTTQLPLADGQTPVLAPVAQDLGKPWFTEEFGFMQDDGDSFRASEFDFVYDEQTSYGSVGSLFWNLGPEVGLGTFDVNPSTPLTWARMLAEAP